MYILLTRPKKQALLLQNELKAHSIKTVIEPLFSVKYLKNISQEVEKIFAKKFFQAIIITSSNAIDPLKDILPRNIALYTVGEKTCYNLKKMGFPNAQFVAESAEDLCKWIIDNLAQTGGDIFYPSGSITSVDIERLLGDKGFSIQQMVVYQTIPLKNISNKTLKLIYNKQIESIVFYSLETAKIFIELAKNSKLEDYIKHMEAYVLSDKIASKLEVFSWHKIYVADSPNTKTLINMIINNG